MRQKIPTLLAMIVLIALIGFGIFLQIVRKNQTDSQKLSLTPKYQQVANLTHTSATVIWQTDFPTVGSVKINNQIAIDDRDTSETTTPRTSHFVTVNDLSPNTNYEYQILNSDFSFEDQAYQLTTNAAEVAEKQLNTPASPAIRGSLINVKNEPETEAIIVLNAKDLAPKATYLTIAGNFVLPLSKLSNAAGTDIAIIQGNLPATLEIRKGEVVSFVQITIPLKDRALPALTLGKNDNLTALLQQPQPAITPLEFIAKKPVFDLNNDGKINTLDSSLINDLITKKQFNPIADFNNDKVIDNGDLILIKAEIR